MREVLRGLRGQGRWLYVIGGFVLAAAASAYYILSQQHVVTPLADRYTVRAEFANTTGLEPGLGQPVNVAGVRVGTITDATLDEGRSLVRFSIDPQDLAAVYRDAHATLVPNSPLNDLQVELYPGSASAGRMPQDGEIPVSATEPPAQLDELLAALDHDTRDYVQILLGEADRGLRGRAADLHALLGTLRPTAQQLHEVSAALARRHTAMRDAVHNLSVLTTATAGSDRQLASVVGSAGRTVHALADQEGALRTSVARLPGTLQAARQVVGDTAFTRRLRPTLDALQPAARRLPAALAAARPLVAQAVPLLRDQIRPLTTEAQPLLRDLTPLTRDLSAVTPSLHRAFSVLGYLGNELAFNPAGPDEGYLFWTAWLMHNLSSIFSIGDANGVVMRGFLVLDCDSLAAQSTLAQTLIALAAQVPSCR